MKMEQSVPKRHTIQRPGNYPEESIKHSEHGESLKSRIMHMLIHLALFYLSLWYWTSWTGSVFEQWRCRLRVSVCTAATVRFIHGFTQYIQVYAGMVPPLVYERFNITFCPTLIHHRRSNPRCWQIRKLHCITCLIISAVGLYKHHYRRALWNRRVYIGNVKDFHPCFEGERMTVWFRPFKWCLETISTALT